MKLSTKISAAAVSLLLILSQAFAVWNLTQTRKHLLDTIAQAELRQLESDCNQFMQEYTRMAIYFQDERGERFWAEDTFRRSYSENSVLYFKGEEISNSTPYEFDLKDKKGEKIELPNGRFGPGNVRMFQENVGGRELLIFSLTDQNFQIVHYRDVTEVYQESNALFWRGIAMSALLSAVLLAAMILLLRKILKPFYRPRARRS